MSEAVILAIINNMGGWLTAIVALVGAVAGAWSLIQSSRAKKEVAQAKVDAAGAVETLTTKANETQAMAVEARREMAQAREENRKIYYQFADTDTFMSKVSEPTDSGRPGLSPLTDAAPLTLDDGPCQTGSKA